MSVTYDTAEYISGGYFITKIVNKAPYLAAPTLPPQLISASTCLAPVIPDTWTFNWTSQETVVSREQKAAEFGIAAADTLPFCEHVTELERQKKVGYNRVIFELETARQLGQKFIPFFHEKTAPAKASQEAQPLLLGLGLDRRFVRALLTQKGPGPTGFADMLRQKQPLALGGVALGWEVLCYGEFNEFHSWLCNIQVSEASQKFGIELNEHGLLSDFEQAEQLAQWIEKEGRGEPGLWRPWLVLEYAM